MELKLRVLQFVFNVDIAATITVFRWPAIDLKKKMKVKLELNSMNDELTCKRNCTFILCRESPFKDTNIGVHWERLSWILQPDLALVSEQFLVNVRMGLQLNSTLIIVVQEDFDATKLFIGYAQRQQTRKLESLKSAIATQPHRQLVFDSNVNAVNRI